MSSHEYCIIGGGPAGIGVGRCLARANIPFRIFESESDFGGIWNYGQPCSAVYDSTHLISSRKNTEFSDFPMPDDYPDYPSHQQMHSYLRAVAKDANLYECTTFNTRVTSLVPSAGHCELVFESGEELSFKGAIVASGRLSESNIPQYDGHFDGEIIHSKDYRSPSSFVGKTVLVIGGGNSGCDIAVDTIPFAERTIHSMNKGYHFMPKYIAGLPTQDWLMQIGAKFSSTEKLWEHVSETFRAAGFCGEDYGLPAPDHKIDQAHPIMNSLLLYHIGHGNVSIKPDVARFDGRTVVFTDGSRESCDVIILATGYKTTFPFLDSKICKSNLFMHIFHPEFDSLLFAGFVNASSGLGNVVNSAGQMIASYLRASERDCRSLQVFRALKQGGQPDLGQDHFVTSDRHSTEVDVWKFLKSMSFLRDKFNNTESQQHEYI